MACMHGLSAESPKSAFDVDDTPIRTSHALQLAKAREWIDEGGGGLLGGDFNRVPCCSWRTPQMRKLSDDDLRMRDACGWRCACCKEDGEMAASSRLVGASDAGTVPPWTRWHTKNGIRQHPTACIDYVIAFGSEEHRWTSEVAAPAVKCSGTSGDVVVSDHSWISVISREEVTKGDVRPKPTVLNTAKEKAAFTDAMGTTTADIRAGVHAAEGQEGSAVEAAVVALVAAGKRAVETAADTIEASQGQDKRRDTPQGRYQTWRKRLKYALRLRARGVEPSAAMSSGFFRHSLCLNRITRWPRPRGRTWELIITRCRAEVDAAGKAYHAAHRKQDEKLYELARDKSLEQGDAAIRMQRVWRALKESKASTALTKVWEEDVVPPADEPGREGKCIRQDDERFLDELRKIGEKFVFEMEDAPACIPCFEAWCEVFMPSWSELEGVDGGTFDLRKELTWSIFMEALHAMPSGKAVGEGGFSASLLRAASDEVRQLVYQAIIADLTEGKVSKHWKVVLYALLVKPAPNDPDVVSQRREIALMAHDMKLLLQMVKRVCYQRIIGRISKEQGGWLPGYGTPDVATTAATVIQQNARRKGTLYMLYIDLATFFPRIDRDVLTVAEMLHGVPKQVRKLTARIFGNRAEMREVVQCRYDSAAGLGKPFKNWMGALMGCVLSPDRAKLLLNTILVAINATCKGVPLWGYDEDGLNREITQMMFADDWLGVFSSVAMLRRAWAIWRCWEAATGSKLGVKGKLKTVVTGVRHDEQGRAHSVGDPGLLLRGGKTVPYLLHNEAYKHLGHMRCADGADKIAWEQLKRKLEIALRRLRRMRRPSTTEFIQVSNALLNGLAGYYLQSFYITFEQAEVIERQWRAIYRKKFGGTFEEDQSKPRVLFYMPKGDAKTTRMHIWAAGLTALAVNYGEAASDPEDTSQRAAVRSSVAEALHTWGCREDPSGWEWTHLGDALESTLRTSSCKQLGDAWMLATMLLEQEHNARWEEIKDSVSGWIRDFGGEQRASWGRWQGPFPDGDPMSSTAAHWRAHSSLALYEPTEKGGLGMRIEPMLLNAGISELGHMVTETGRFWLEHGPACRRHTRLPRHGAAAAAWKRQVQLLNDMGMDPQDSAPVSARAARRLRRPPAVDGTDEFEERLMRMTHDLNDPEICLRRGRSSWKRALLRAAPSQASQTPAAEWNFAGRDRAREASGPLIVTDMANDGHVRETGGQASWYKRTGADAGKQVPATCWGEHPTGADTRTTGDEQFGVSSDGYAEDHEPETDRLLQELRFNECGMPIGIDGVEMTIGAIGDLPPALQIQARARLTFGDKVDVVQAAPAKRKKAEERGESLDAPGDEELQGGKQAARPKEKGTRVISLDVQEANRQTMARAQARYRLTSCWCTDGSRTFNKAAETEMGDGHVTARGAARHDGLTLGGCIAEPEGADNYLAELAALIDVFNAEDEGGRVMVVFDATSPVVAWLRYRKASARARRGYYASRWFEALDRLIQRMEVVVFLWQTSHVGSPVNEWADVLAEAATGDSAVAVVRGPSRCAAAPYTMQRKSIRHWAGPLSERVVRSRLAETVCGTQRHGAADIPQVPLPDKVQRTCEAVAAQRSCMGDERRRAGWARRVADKLTVCPFGCKCGGVPCPYTWAHVQLRCKHDETKQKRDEWEAAIRDAAPALACAGARPTDSIPHSDLILVQHCLKGTFRERQTRPAAGSVMALPTGDDLKVVQRVAGGIVTSTGNAKQDNSRAVRAAMQSMTIAGAAVQHAAHEATKEQEKQAHDTVCKLAKARKFAIRWRNRVFAGGPMRAGMLRGVYEMVSAVVEHITRSDMATDEATAALERLLPSSDPRHICRRSVKYSLLQEARVASGDRPPGDVARAEWYLLALASRWRFRTCFRLEAWEACESDVWGDSGVNDSRAKKERGWSTCADASELMRRLTGVRSDVCARRPKIFSSDEGGRTLMGIKWRTWAAWQLGGRRTGLRKAHDEVRREDARLEIRAQADRLQKFRQQTPGIGPRPRHLRGLSGNTLPAHEEHIHVVIGKRSRGRRQADSTREPAIQSAFKAGRVADRWDRYAVERVLEVRRVANQGARRVVEARLRWRGCHPVTGAPWKDSWRPLWESGKSVMNGVLEDEARRMADTRWGKGNWDEPRSREVQGEKRKRAGTEATKRAAGSRHSARLERADKTRRWGRVVIDSEDEHTLGMAQSRRRKTRIEEGDSE